MDALNSTSSRAATPQQNMRNLEKAITVGDQRIRMRRTATGNGQIALAMLFAIPFSSYMIYNLFGASGVMQNYKASSGAYMAYAMTFMMKPRSITSTFRPELEFSNQSGALHSYTKKIEAQRKAGTLPEGVYHPTSWL